MPRRAIAWLAFQLLYHSALTVDPERCTGDTCGVSFEWEAPEPVMNERALLQAGVGKQRVVLEQTGDSESLEQTKVSLEHGTSKSEKRTGQVPVPASTAPAAVPVEGGTLAPAPFPPPAPPPQTAQPAAANSTSAVQTVVQPMASPTIPEANAAQSNGQPKSTAASQTIAQQAPPQATAALTIAQPKSTAASDSFFQTSQTIDQQASPEAPATEQTIAQAKATVPAQSLVQQAPEPQAETGAAQEVVQPKPLGLEEQDEAEAVWLYLARSSVVSILQKTAHRIREGLPARLVDVFPSLKTDIGAAFGLSLVSAAIWCTLVGAIACLYRSHKAFTQAISSRPEQDFNDWTSGPFDFFPGLSFFSDLKVCCWSCWCPCIRWADNMDMLGILSFWVGLLVFCGLVLLNTVPGGLLLWLIASLLWMSFRQQLRMKFDMEQNTLRTFVGDCALYCCCWPCAIAQEARHIEEASRAAHKAVRKIELV